MEGSLSDYLISNHGICIGTSYFYGVINDLLNIDCDGSVFYFADDKSIILGEINKNNFYYHITVY